MSAAPQTPAPENPETPDAPTGFKSKLPMIAIIAVGIAIGGGTGAVVVGPMVAKKMGKVVLPPADSASAHGEAAGGAGHGGTAGEKGGGSEASVHLLENLVLNPAGSNGARFLLLSVAIEAGSPAVATEMTTRDAELRDIILTALGGKTVDQIGRAHV